jgi:hypothetical protein
MPDSNVRGTFEYRNYRISPVIGSPLYFDFEQRFSGIGMILVFGYLICVRIPTVLFKVWILDVDKFQGVGGSLSNARRLT